MSFHSSLRDQKCQKKKKNQQESPLKHLCIQKKYLANSAEEQSYSILIYLKYSILTENIN